MNVLQRCVISNSVRKAHCQIITGGYQQNPFTGAKLLAKYAQCGSSYLQFARKVFGYLSDKDVLSWNTLIRVHANAGCSLQAISIYEQMRRSGVEPNRYTYPFVLKACSKLKRGIEGSAIHSQAIKYSFDSDLFVGNALVAFYAKIEEIGLARTVFNEIPLRDLVSWNSMISGYASNGQATEALTLFRALVGKNHAAELLPDTATLVSVLPACAEVVAIQDGMWIHSYIIKHGKEIDAALGSGLVSMYSNCGHPQNAWNVFNQIVNNNIVSYSAIIRCYGMHGYAEKALSLFSQFLELGMQPDGLIFLCVLWACSHAGMVEKGREIFLKMEDYGVERNGLHYACMIDLSGRAGLLGEAFDFIRSMPVQPGKDAYGALLGACRVHNKLFLAEEIAEKLLLIDPENAGRYVIMANMYKDMGHLEDAAKLRKSMRDKKVKKPMGFSSLELSGIQHTFGMEDESHPNKAQIFEAVKFLNKAVNEGLLVSGSIIPA